MQCNLPPCRSQSTIPKLIKPKASNKRHHSDTVSILSHQRVTKVETTHVGLRKPQKPNIDGEYDDDDDMGSNLKPFFRTGQFGNKKFHLNFHNF